MWSLFFLGPSLMWSLFLLGHSLIWSLLFFGPQFDVEFVFLGDQFDVEFFFWGPVWCGVFLYWAAVWCGVCVLDGSLRGPSLAQLGFWHKESSLAHRFFAESTAISDWRWNTSCVPACLPACLTHSLTHSLTSLSHAWRKQGCTWQSPSERAWLPGRGTWEKDYAEPNWRIRTCAFSRGSRCPMMIMMMSAAIHCSILHTHNNIYIYKQMRIWFLAIISYSCASDSEQKLLSSSSCLLPCLLARLPAAHLSFCK